MESFEEIEEYVIGHMRRFCVEPSDLSLNYREKIILAYEALGNNLLNNILEKEKALEPFYRNVFYCEDDSFPAEGWDRFDIVSCAFAWDMTPEGETFWGKIMNIVEGSFEINAREPIWTGS